MHPTQPSSHSTIIPFSHLSLVHHPTHPSSHSTMSHSTTIPLNHFSLYRHPPHRQSHSTIFHSPTVPLNHHPTQPSFTHASYHVTSFVHHHIQPSFVRNLTQPSFIRHPTQSMFTGFPNHSTNLYRLSKSFNQSLPWLSIHSTIFSTTLLTILHLSGVPTHPCIVPKLFAARITTMKSGVLVDLFD